MDTHQFKIGDRVMASSVWPGDNRGTVDNFNDWWVVVRMDHDGVKRPFMEGELQHEQANSLRSGSGRSGNGAGDNQG